VTKVEIVAPCTRCVDFKYMIVQDIDKESDAGTNIRGMKERLKELIASETKDFFFGNSTFSSFPITNK